MQTSNTLIKEPAFSLFRQMESGNVRVENQTETKDVRDEVVEGLQKLTGSQEVRLQEQSTGSWSGENSHFFISFTPKWFDDYDGGSTDSDDCSFHCCPNFLFL